MIIKQFITKGIIRSLVVAKFIELTFLSVFNTKKSNIGSKKVSSTNEKSFALTIGIGKNLGDFEK